VALSVGIRSGRVLPCTLVASVDVCSGRVLPCTLVAFVDIHFSILLLSLPLPLSP